MRLVPLLALGGCISAVLPYCAQANDAAKAILSDLLSIDTTHEKGTVAAVEMLQHRFLAAGFRPSMLSVLANPANPSQASLVVRFKGTGKIKPLLYLCHLDVVPAQAEDWTVPPFQLTEKEGWIYGRGSLDMKGEDANIVAALLRLKREGYLPARDIVVAFTPDEEMGGHEGIGWLLREHRELIDASLSLNPDAGAAAFREGRRAFYGVQTSEKSPVTFWVETTNKGGHSSEPRSDNAIYELTAAMNRLAEFQFPIRLTQTTREAYATQAIFESGVRREAMLSLGQGDVGAAMQLVSDPAENALLRTTCVATRLQAGQADNALPQRARATIQCRMLPGDTEISTKSALQQAIADPHVEIEVSQGATLSPESSPTDKVMGLYRSVVHSMWPRLPVMPNMDAGASDSKYTRAAGIPSYGAVSIFYDLEDMRAHGRDERIRSDRFDQGSEFAYRLMKAFSTSSAP